MMMSDVTEFGVIGTDKFEYNPVSLVDPQEREGQVLNYQF
jgi:hypothetical protein